MRVFLAFAPWRLCVIPADSPPYTETEAKPASASRTHATIVITIISQGSSDRPSNPSTLSRLLPGARPSRRPQLVALARQRPDTAVDQRRACFPVGLTEGSVLSSLAA